MIIRNGDIFNGFTKVDKAIFTDRRLTDGAKVLYAYLLGLRSGANFVDKYVMKGLGITQQVLTKRKKELKDARLIETEQIAPRLYVLYVANSKMDLYKTKEKWRKIEDYPGQAVEKKKQ